MTSEICKLIIKSISLDEVNGLSYRPAIMLTLPSWAIVVGIIGLVAAVAYILGHFIVRH